MSAYIMYLEEGRKEEKGWVGGREDRGRERRNIWKAYE